MPLSDNCVAYWPLDEVSGNRRDIAGANTLTDNNTVTQALGPGKPFAQAGQFTAANLEYLDIADNAALSAGDVDFTCAAWVYMDSQPANLMQVFGKEGATNALSEYVLRWDNSGNRFQFVISGTGWTTVNANNFGAPSTGVWYLIVCWHDSVANTINIQVNNGTANSTGTGAQTPNDSTSAFEIGRAAPYGRYWNGRIGGVCVWKRVLTEAERSFLWNNGSGRIYPFVDDPVYPTPLVPEWKPTDLSRWQRWVLKRRERRAR